MTWLKIVFIGFVIVLLSEGLLFDGMRCLLTSTLPVQVGTTPPAPASPVSMHVTMLICTVGLGAVIMVTATVVESLSNVISVGWNRTPYASGYLVYVNYGMGGAFIVNITGGDTSSNVSVQCLALNTLQVQAYNSSAFSSLSPAVQVYTYCCKFEGGGGREGGKGKGKEGGRGQEGGRGSGLCQGVGDGKII